jgi:hypothetical protein
MAWRGEELQTRFDGLGNTLRQHQHFWRAPAFTYLKLPWENTEPELAKALRELKLDEAEILAGDQAQLANFLRPWLNAANVIVTDTAVPAIDARTLPKLPEPYGVPGRKWLQIQAFAASMPPSKSPVLEWCAGKAHLSRLLARQFGCTATALEWNADLIEQGNVLTRREQLPVTLHCADVLQPATANFLQRDQQVAALHACGDLHIQLLRYCTERQPYSLMLAPCCYQLIATDNYQPLSHRARVSDLKLARSDLFTAVLGTVTSSSREQRLRIKLQQWRLGFDLLQREVRGIDGYLHTPSMPLSVLNRSFESFCREFAQQKNIELPAHVDFAFFEAAGAERQREVTALDLPRFLFRRALELWLVLDRALFLQENGYRVAVGEFCEQRLTPRNLVIYGVRSRD